jgi:hypothetical protein
MFNKKVVTILCWILQVLIIAKTLFELVMYFWGAISGNPPISIFQQGVTYGSFLSVLLVLQELGGNVFMYVIVAAIKSLVDMGPSKKK